LDLPTDVPERLRIGNALSETFLRVVRGARTVGERGGQAGKKKKKGNGGKEEREQGAGSPGSKKGRKGKKTLSPQ